MGSFCLLEPLRYYYYFYNFHFLLWWWWFGKVYETLKWIQKKKKKRKETFSPRFRSAPYFISYNLHLYDYIVVPGPIKHCTSCSSCLIFTDITNKIGHDFTWKFSNGLVTRKHFFRSVVMKLRIMLQLQNLDTKYAYGNTLFANSLVQYNYPFNGCKKSTMTWNRQSLIILMLNI